jgi:hypothetical protein
MGSPPDEAERRPDEDQVEVTLSNLVNALRIINLADLIRVI